MSFIRTVLGDIAPEELGVCYSHEHLIIDPSFATEQNPEFLLDSVERAVEELCELKVMGVGACVDSMPMECGRNLEKLAEISRRTGIHILAPTGLHLEKYYSPAQNADFSALDANELTYLFCTDIYPDPKVIWHTFPVWCGLIKIAALEQWDERTKTLFKAAARAQAATGAPILTHTENGELALEQAIFLRDKGANLRHVVLSHLDRKPDVETHRAILNTGVTVEYDSHFRWGQRQPNPTLELLRQLLPEFPDQIVWAWTQRGTATGSHTAAVRG